MIEIVYKENKEQANGNEGYFHLPKNIRQVGDTNGRERIYLEEGPEGLAVERRGRKSTGKPKELPSKVEEDLLAEVQRLRAENAYLKNLQALVLEEERRQRKKRR